MLPDTVSRNSRQLRKRRQQHGLSLAGYSIIRKISTIIFAAMVVFYLLFSLAGFWDKSLWARITCVSFEDGSSKISHVWWLERKGKHSFSTWISLNSMNHDNVRKWDGYQGYLESNNRSILVRYQFSVVNDNRYLLSSTIGGNVYVTT